MIKPVMQALAGLAFLLLAACATGPDYAYKPYGASISDPGEVYSTWSWGKEIEAGLIDAGRKDEIETIKAHYTEKGWPAKFADFDTRVGNPDTIKKYRGEVIATFKNGDTPLVVMHVPAKDNGHMPEGWRPKEDIYIVVKQSAIAKTK
jgi:hypothetical protein